MILLLVKYVYRSQCPIVRQTSCIYHALWSYSYTTKYYQICIFHVRSRWQFYLKIQIKEVLTLRLPQQNINRTIDIRAQCNM